MDNFLIENLVFSLSQECLHLQDHVTQCDNTAATKVYGGYNNNATPVEYMAGRSLGKTS